MAAKTYELSELLVDVLGVTEVGAYFPHRVTYHPTCHSLRMLRVGDKPLQLLRAVDGLELVELPRGGAVLRFRRHLRDQERRHVDGDAGRQDAARGGHRRRDVHGGGQLLPDAHRRWAVAGSGPAPGPCTWPRSWPRPGTPSRSELRRDEQPVLLGMPALPPHVPARGRAISAATSRSRMRPDAPCRTRSCGRISATRPATIRAKRAEVVGEVADWEELREAGRQLKVHTMAHLTST